MVFQKPTSDKIKKLFDNHSITITDEVVTKVYDVKDTAKSSASYQNIADAMALLTKYKPDVDLIGIDNQDIATIAKMIKDNYNLVTKLHLGMKAALILYNNAEGEHIIIDSKNKKSAYNELAVRLLDFLEEDPKVNLGKITEYRAKDYTNLFKGMKVDDIMSLVSGRETHKDNGLVGKLDKGSKICSKVR